MRKITIQLLLLLFVAVNVQCTALSSDGNARSVDLTKEVKIASIEDGKMVYTIDKNELLNKLNEQLSNDTLKYVSAEIKIGETIGDKKLSFYYMQFKSNRGSQLLRYLAKENNNYFFKQSAKDEDMYLDTYVTCNGVESCVPNLNSSKEGLQWICGDKLECVRPTKENYCNMSTSIIVDE